MGRDRHRVASLRRHRATRSPKAVQKELRRLDLIGAQLEALEQWIDYRESRGKRGAPAPERLGGYPGGLSRAGVLAAR